jgi:hypothetical protein
MARPPHATLLRVATVVVVIGLGTSTLTFAADRTGDTNTGVAPASRERSAALTVPDVRRQAFVFAKGILADAGFAWRVEGPVRGYAANVVLRQEPAPETRVLDTGAPTVVLELARAADRAEQGSPEDASPYAGTRVVEVSAGDRDVPRADSPPRSEPDERADERPDRDRGSPRAETREPDFHVAGAPREPVDELALPERARRLAARLEAAPRPTPALVRFWLYQHAWVVTGARFGWSDGARALRILIALDGRVQARWGVGARSEALARRALREVLAKAT